MRPLVYHGGLAAYVFFASVGVFTLGEGLLQARTRTEERDPSYLWMLVGSFAGLTLAFLVASHGARLPGPDWLPVAVGVALIWLGGLFRYWSVRTLGRFFTVTVDVEEDHQLVDTGPYALLRHPSYTGMLVVFLGIGIGLDSWLSAASALLIPLAAVVNRIRHEEAVLGAQLGPQYERYATRTKRLLPGIW